MDIIVREKKKYTEIEVGEIFPQTRNHNSHFVDFFENTIFNRATKQLLKFLNYFQFIQNGKVQMYVVYGLFFILLVFFGTIFNLI